MRRSSSSRQVFSKQRYGGGAAPVAEPLVTQTAQTATSAPRMDVGAAGKAKPRPLRSGSWRAVGESAAWLGRGRLDSKPATPS